MKLSTIALSAALATGGGAAMSDTIKDSPLEDDTRICLQNFGGTIQQVGCDIAEIIRAQGGIDKVRFVPTVTLSDGTDVNELRDKNGHTILGIITLPKNKND